MVQHVKLLRRSKVHNGFRFKKGLNILREPFNSWPNCDGGGLYYCKNSDIITWLFLYDDLGWLADVKNPPDAQIVKMPYKLKADKIILSNFRRITQETWLQSLPDAEFMKWLKRNNCYPENLRKEAFQKWLATKSEEFHVRALRITPYYILYLPQASFTERICLTVIRKINTMVLEFNHYLPHFHDHLRRCLEFDWQLIKHFKVIDPYLMEDAVEQNPLALHSVKPVILTDEHIKNFLHLNTRYIKYLPKERLTPTLLNQTVRLVPDAKNPRGFRVIARRDL